MTRFAFLFTFLMVFSTLQTALVAEELAEAKVDSISAAATDWPWWRGPQRNGIAAADQTPPLNWSESKNILWKATLPGRGHCSPTVVGEQVILSTADREQQLQSVLCFHRNTGKLLWKTDVHHGGMTTKGNKKSTQASSTVACDGKRLFVNFLHKDAIYTTTLNRQGKQLWQTKITDYVVHQGYGSSPALYGPLVIVSADNKGGGAISALERATGRVVWTKRRPKMPNYASPIILKTAGRDQLLFQGCEVVSSFDPLSGKKLWEIEGSTTECVTSIVTDGQLVFTSGGYPTNHVSAVRADGSGEIVWESTVRVYVPSMLVQDGYLYAVTDSGVARCWKCSNGEEIWQGRLGGVFTSSPVLVGDKIFVSNEKGQTFIFMADPKKFQRLGVNQLGDEVFSTPTICDSRIYMRVVERKGEQRQEVLYCIAEEK